MLFLATLSAVMALPRYDAMDKAARAVLTSPGLPRDCNGRLVAIDAVITAWASNTAAPSTTVPAKTELLPYLSYQGLLTCPQGGAYELGTSSLATKCSVHGHARFTPLAQQPPFRLSDHLPFLRSRQPAARNSCIANLKQIDGATQQWALENKKLSTDIASPAGVAEYLKGGQQPGCPFGGKYIIRTVSESPLCTVVGHTL
ncbi:MAG: hypothetical protein AB1705_08285 [Verrucomicrobiota bacterium]